MLEFKKSVVGPEMARAEEHEVKQEEMPAPRRPKARTQELHKKTAMRQWLDQSEAHGRAYWPYTS